MKRILYAALATYRNADGHLCGNRENRLAGQKAQV